MSGFQHDLLKLIQSALTGQKFTLSQDLDWARAISFSKSQNISAMLYYGAVNCGLQDEAVLNQLFKAVYGMITVDERQSYELARVFEAFENAGIDYLPLKGTVLKKIYPKPEMRAMGDADILIKESQYEQIKPIMKNLGYTQGAESDHELKWHTDALYLELHHRIISPDQKDFYVYWQDPWSKAVKDGAGHRYRMSDEDTFIYLLTHFAIHYRAGGAGIKYAVDLWLYLKNQNLDFEYIEKELSELRLLDFYKNTVLMLQSWFGDEPFNDATAFMSRFIFSGGVFGTYERNALARAVKTSKSSDSLQKTRRRELRRIFFLPYKNMCKKYPFLRRFPILLPVMWGVRGIDVLLFRRVKLKKLDVGVKTVTPENIQAYRQSLNLVGLDFLGE